jgi:hypothetical protein
MGTFEGKGISSLDVIRHSHVIENFTDQVQSIETMMKTIYCL